MERVDVWDALPSVPWQRLCRIHGNCHSSMIGLITGWWVDLDDRNWVLDGAPGYRSRRDTDPPRYQSPRADAIFCGPSGPVGVLEVEGNPDRYEGRAETIGHYMGLEGDRHAELEGIRFGLLVLYPVQATRKQGTTEMVKVPEVAECLQRAGQITKELSSTELIVVVIDKMIEPDLHPVRSRSEYHRCTVCRVNGIRFAGGDEMERATYVP